MQDRIKTNFFKNKIYRPQAFECCTVYCYKSYILNKCCPYLTFYSSKNPERSMTGSNIANKSALHKMYFKSI